MGLDMYFTAKMYASEYSSKEFYDKVMPALQSTGLFLPPQYIENFKSLELELPVAYWRKANHIHAWFVEHVQNGTDDCGNYEVEIDKIRELAKLCSEVAASGQAKDAEAKLPSKSGFFFGGVEYDEWYFEQTRDTMEALDKLLADVDAGKLEGWSFQYHSSW